MLTDSSALPAFSHKLQPYEHQQKGLILSQHQKAFALFMEMGTGKSKIIIDTFTQLFLNREIDGVILTAPKSFYLNWYEELQIHMHEWLPVRMAHWDADLGRGERERLFQLLKPQDNILDIVLVNIEAFATDRGYQFIELFARMHYNFMTVDESTCIKNSKAVRTKAAIKIGQLCDYRRILTGTPMTQGPLDLYGQIEFLQPGYLGFTSFSCFKDYYAETRRIELGNRSFEKIVRYKNIEELKEKIAPIIYRVLKTECLDLPEKIFITQHVEWTPEQKKRYTELKEEAITQFSQNSVVTCESILTVLMKLHQINCGHVIDDNGTAIAIPSNRIKVLLELIECVEGKVIIWCKFKRDVLNIIAALEDTYGEGSAVHYYGDTSNAERALHKERFKRDDTCRFFVSNETGSKSLTLVQSSYAIYFSYDHKLETWLQSQDRNHRIGQEKNCTYVVMSIPKTVDVAIMKSLFAKRDIADEVLDNWRELLK